MDNGATKLCHACMSRIPLLARRCPLCTSHVDGNGCVVDKTPPPQHNVQHHVQPYQQHNVQHGPDNSGTAILYTMALFASLFLSNWINSVWPFCIWILAVIMAFVNLVLKS